ncbi:hypothetical protein J6TS7_14630 [Paenibacillus dendritiformis]|nr:hypothetical protein J6TS7_14630 [Paenibacillus dendritiformis]
MPVIYSVCRFHVPEERFANEFTPFPICITFPACACRQPLPLLSRESRKLLCRGGRKPLSHY